MAALCLFLVLRCHHSLSYASLARGQPKLEPVVGLPFWLLPLSLTAELTSPDSGCSQDTHSLAGHSLLLPQQQFSEALEDPTGSVRVDRQDTEKQKQSSFVCLPEKM